MLETTSPPPHNTNTSTLSLALVVAAVVVGYLLPHFIVHSSPDITPAEAACVAKEANSLLGPSEKIFVTAIATHQKINRTFTATVYTVWAQPYATVMVTGLTTGLGPVPSVADCNFEASSIDRKFF